MPPRELKTNPPEINSGATSTSNIVDFGKSFYPSDASSSKPQGNGVGETWAKYQQMAFNRKV